MESGVSIGTANEVFGQTRESAPTSWRGSSKGFQNFCNLVSSNSSKDSRYMDHSTEPLSLRTPYLIDFLWLLFVK